MLEKRFIPNLLLRGESLVKTKNFRKFQYIGDPCNTVRIFNELEVDELAIQDITASKTRSDPNYSVLRDVANECFMPLSYGGGIDTLDKAKKIYDIGIEKIILNTHALENPSLITEIANIFGSQAVIVSVDYKRNFFGETRVMSYSGTKKTKYSPNEWCKQLQSYGAGEILLTSIDKEGTWKGFDNETIKLVSDQLNIPVIANGGCGSVEDIEDLLLTTNVSAVALGSILVFQKKGMGVLVNFPDRNRLDSINRVS